MLPTTTIRLDVDSWIHFLLAPHRVWLTPFDWVPAQRGGARSQRRDRTRVSLAPLPNIVGSDVRILLRLWVQCSFVPSVGQAVA
jgi:hypothetical protein